MYAVGPGHLFLDKENYTGGKEHPFLMPQLMPQITRLFPLKSGANTPLVWKEKKKLTEVAQFCR